MIKDNQVLLVISGTGSGKSVLIPKYALHATNYEGKVVITNPKKYSTRTNAEFAADAMDVKLGEEVGYQFRGAKLDDGRPSKTNKTKLLFSTDGSVVAQLINDPKLSTYDVVIVDEAHERKIQIDLLLLLMKKALKLNPNLKLIIMSATINPEIFANYFKNDFKYDQIEVSGKTNYPVEIKYLTKPLKDPINDFLDAGVFRIIEILKETDDGDIIFFVNSLDEAIKSCQKLHEKVSNAKLNKVFCVELGSASDSEKQKYAQDPILYRSHPNGPFSRKIIIATNAVESSATFEGLLYVIDSGWAYVDSYDPLKMERRLLQERISKAQAKQRTGRVGRTKPGLCYRLYTENEYNNFIDFPITDIRKSDLTDDILRFMKLPYVSNINSLLNLLKELIEPPLENFIKSALYRLYAFDAIDNMSGNGKLTQLGQMMVRFRKLDPMMAKIVIESYKYVFNLPSALINIAIIVIISYCTPYL
jgi:pre-mRNA-splicing factor ATP-dependent RNA helicase DHX15/PRP43